MMLVDALARCQEKQCNLLKPGGFCRRYEYAGRGRSRLMYVGKLVPITEVEDCNGQLADPAVPVMSDPGD